MGFVVCGGCGGRISDHGTEYEASLFPDVNETDDGKCFDVFECQECGSLTIFYRLYGSSGFYVYTPKNGKNNELTRISIDQFDNG